MSEIGSIAPGLRQREDGIWVSARRPTLSYPEDGNVLKFELEERSFWFAHRNACIVEAVRAFPPAGPLFDVGGGNGVVSMALERAGFETVLVEPAPAGARNARSRGLSRVVCAALEDAGIAPGTLPAVGLFDVIEHIEDDVDFLRRTAAFVRPGGRIYLTVPAHRWLWSSEDEYAGHFRRYSGRHLKDVMHACGLEAEYQTHLFGPLPVPILLVRSIPSRLRWRGLGSRHQETREHHAPGGPAGAVLASLLALEVRAIVRRRSFPFGSSCLAVARVPAPP